MSNSVTELDEDFEKHLSRLRRAAYPSSDDYSIPDTHVRLALRHVLNKFDELMAYAGKREETLDYLSEQATGLWGDLGAPAEVRDEAHRKLAAVYDFLDYLRKRGDGHDEFG